MTGMGMKKMSRVRFYLILATLLTFSVSTVVGASQYISQSYSAGEKLAEGSLVSLVENSFDRVVAADNSNVENMLGVVVNASGSVLSISGEQENKTEVATGGTLQVLVSDANGSVVKGSQITASPISGVGMKATTNVRVVGIAQSDLDSTNASQQTYTDKNGKKNTVLIGQIPVLVNVSYFFKEPDKTLVPSALQSIANALAGRTVSTLPILISVAIFIITLIVVVSIIYAMIRSSIISVGRNPMSQSAIYRDLVQLSALVLAILTVGMIAIYLVLTRM